MWCGGVAGRLKLPTSSHARMIHLSQHLNMPSKLLDDLPGEIRTQRCLGFGPDGSNYNQPKPNRSSLRSMARLPMAPQTLISIRTCFKVTDKYTKKRLMSFGTTIYFDFHGREANVEFLRSGAFISTCQRCRASV